jgi:hypothetical protein
MFDFQATLDEADQAFADKDYAWAVFNYWLIDFAFNDEDIPYFYSREIGDKANEMFYKLIEEHKNGILNSESYLRKKKNLSIYESYRKYFCHFERVVRSFM